MKIVLGVVFMNFNKQFFSITLLMCAGTLAAQEEHTQIISSVPETFQEIVDEMNAREDDILYINNLANDIKVLFEDITEHIKNIMNPDDNTSIAQYIAIFDQKLNFMRNSLMSPLKEKLNKRSDHASPYYKVLNTSHEILNELYNQLNIIIKTVKKPDNQKTGKKMAQALHEQKDLLTKKYDFVDKKLSELQDYMQQLCLGKLVQDIARIRVTLNSANTKNKPLTTAEKSRIATILERKLRKK